MSHPGSREMRRLRRDFAELCNDIGDLGHALSDVGGERGKAVYRQTAQQGLHLRDGGEAALDSAQHILRARPFSSALVAMTVGCIVAAAITVYRKARY